MKAKAAGPENPTKSLLRYDLSGVRGGHPCRCSQKLWAICPILPQIFRLEGFPKVATFHGHNFGSTQLLQFPKTVPKSMQHIEYIYSLYACLKGHSLACNSLTKVGHGRLMAPLCLGGS